MQKKRALACLKMICVKFLTNHISNTDGEIVYFGKSDKITKISGKVDKSNTYYHCPRG